MRQFFTSSQGQQLLAVGVPLLALALTLAVVYPAWGRYDASTKEISKLRAELQKLEDTPLPPRDPVVPAVDDGPRESAQFLGQIVALTLAPQCRFTGMQTRMSGSLTPDGLLKPVSARLEVEGMYPQVRDFLAQIRNSPRLFVVTSVDVNTRAGTSNQPGVFVSPRFPGVRAGVEIQRFVVPQNAPVVAAGDQTGTQPGGSQPQAAAAASQGKGEGQPRPAAASEGKGKEAR